MLRSVVFRSCVALILIFCAGASVAQEIRDVRAYVWGNSLIYHLTNNDDTKMPHWLHRLAEADGRSLKLSGQGAFGRDFPDKIPPVPEWSFKEVTNLWNSETTPYAAVRVNTILINPENFIQYRAPDLPYEGGNPDGRSPLSGTSDLLNWVATQDGNPTVFLYEGWAEMDSFPPTRRKYRRYQAYTLEEYHEWYQAYRDGVARAMPAMDVRLIPVGSILTKLITEGPLQDLRPADLYSDNSPHGTATTYLIAAMITYSALYNAPPPGDFDRFDGVNDKLVTNYQEAADFIWTEMQGFAAPRAESTAANESPNTPTETPEAPQEVVKVAPEPEVTPVAEPAPEETPVPVVAEKTPEDASNAEGLTNPSMAMGLNGIADWSTQHPFVDLMKTARPWLGHVRGQWGGFDAKALEKAGHLDAQGWLKSIPEGVDRVETYILTEQYPEATALRGTYRMTWEGQGKLDLIGLGRVTQIGDNVLTFAFEPADGLVALVIRDTDPNGTGNYIRNIRIMRKDHIPLYEAGVVFNPEFVARIADLRSIRYMDWMYTNGSPKVTWDDRANVDDFTYVRRGVPIEHMVTLANQIGADPWFNMPHKADDGHIRAFAELVKATLDPRLRPIVEYSNELWNRVFTQTTWAVEQGEARWGPGAPDDAWMQFAGMRGAQAMEIWRKVYGDGFVPTVGVQTGWPGLEEPLLEAPLWVAEGGTRPADSYSAYAVSGYFGYALGTDERAPAVLEVIDNGEQRALKSGRNKGLRRVALREHVREHRFEGTFAPVADMLRDGSFRNLIEELWPYHAKVAQRYGLQMLMYEGGTHVTGVGAYLDDERLATYFQAFNYSPEMGEIYVDLLQSWRNVGGTLFNAFVDVAPPTKFGSWGNLRHLQDDTPRWRALEAFNRENPGWWEQRRSDAFVHGVTLWGSDRSEKFDGTTEEDVIMAGGGNDLLISRGRADHLNGGPGRDIVELPDLRGAYKFRQIDGRVLAEHALGTATLYSVEIIRFGDGTEAALDGL